jgi:hypothetical protein
VLKLIDFHMRMNLALLGMQELNVQAIHLAASVIDTAAATK